MGVSSPLSKGSEKSQEFAAAAQASSDLKQQSGRRAWRRITKQERLMLEATVNFGLPVDRAGKVIKMSSRNANRIMKGQIQENKEQARELQMLTESERQNFLQRNKAEQDAAEQQSLFIVAAAMAEG